MFDLIGTLALWTGLFYAGWFCKGKFGTLDAMKKAARDKAEEITK